jgi:heme exporter protein C
MVRRRWLMILYRWACPRDCFRRLQRILPCMLLLSACLFAMGLYQAWYVAPMDFQQGDAYRIMFVHVPCALLSLMAYLIMALASMVFWIWRIQVADLLAFASARVGIAFTFLALLTGSLWGKPMWGTWWVWDARLTSELLLLFLYGGYLGLRGLRGKNAAIYASIVAMIGAIDLPIIHFSVTWWHTLHQPASVLRFGRPSMAAEMLRPLLWMLAAFVMIFFSMLAAELRILIMQSKLDHAWLKRFFRSKAALLNADMFEDCHES